MNDSEALAKATELCAAEAIREWAAGMQRIYEVADAVIQEPPFAGSIGRAELLTAASQGGGREHAAITKVLAARSTVLFEEAIRQALGQLDGKLVKKAKAG